MDYKSWYFSLSLTEPWAELVQKRDIPVQYSSKLETKWKHFLNLLHVTMVHVPLLWPCTALDSSVCLFIAELGVFHCWFEDLLTKQLKIVSSTPGKGGACVFRSSVCLISCKAMLHYI